MLAGRMPRLANDLAQSSYFGGRKPADGRLDWQQPAQKIYNLHRAVAPPYPGAWTVLGNATYVIGKARLAIRSFPDLLPGLAVVDNAIFGIGIDGKALAILSLLRDGQPVSAETLQQQLNVPA